MPHVSHVFLKMFLGSELRNFVSTLSKFDDTRMRFANSTYSTKFRRDFAAAFPNICYASCIRKIAIQHVFGNYFMLCRGPITTFHIYRFHPL